MTLSQIIIVSFKLGSKDSGLVSFILPYQFQGYG